MNNVNQPSFKNTPNGHGSLCIRVKTDEGSRWEAVSTRAISRDELLAQLDEFRAHIEKLLPLLAPPEAGR